MQPCDMWFISSLPEAHQIQREKHLYIFSDTVEVSLTGNDQLPGVHQAVKTM